MILDLFYLSILNSNINYLFKEGKKWVSWKRPFRNYLETLVKHGGDRDIFWSGFPYPQEHFLNANSGRPPPPF